MKDGFYVGQVLKKKIFEFEQTDRSLKMFEIEIWLILMPIIVFLLAIGFLFTGCRFLPKFKKIKKIRLIEMIIFNLLGTVYHLSKKTNPISLIIVFYSIYFMIFKSMIINNIKSRPKKSELFWFKFLKFDFHFDEAQSVIVDTSLMIDSESDLLNAKQYLNNWFHSLKSKFNF